MKLKASLENKPVCSSEARQTFSEVLTKLQPQLGFEPRTSALPRQRSNQAELLGHISCAVLEVKKLISPAGSSGF